MANERIKEEAKVTTEQVAEAIKASVPGKGVHKEKVKQKIYVGPNLLGLPKYTVVESLKVPHVEKIIKECAEVEKLFVSINQMAETETRTATKGTLENRYFNKVMEFKAGKGVK